MLNTEEILYGGELDDEAAAIIQAGDGGFVIAGTTYSFGAGDADFWLIKVDSSGNMEWNRTYGGPEADVTTDMIQTSDGGYALAGKTYSFGAGESDFWLIKVDSSGSMQWNRTYGQATGEAANSVIQSSDGGYALAGYFVQNESNTDGWLVKTDSVGDMQWNVTYGWARNDFVNCVIQTADGGYALAGTTYSFGDSAYDPRCWLVKTDAEGNMEWETTYRDEDEESKNFTGYSVVQTDDGGYTLAASAGFIIGIVDAWVAHVDSNGTMEWVVTWGPIYPALVSSMIQTADGGYAVSGRISSMGGYPTMKSYLFLFTVSSNGTLNVGGLYEGLGDNFGLFAVQTDDGGYALAGTTKSREDGAHSEIWFSKADADCEQIPEFSSWMVLPLIMAAVLVAVVMRRRICVKKL
ncbi:MAG: hypothetical protein NWF06_10290 [Candidatus Bathyarchaeota archaeon]|nr:hypothetical protein [Candidatus Bathyarchaeum sp.]